MLPLVEKTFSPNVHGPTISFQGFSVGTFAGHLVKRLLHFTLKRKVKLSRKKKKFHKKKVNNAKIGMGNLEKN